MTSSDIIPRISDLITTLRTAVERAQDARTESNRIVLTSRALAAATAVIDERDKLEAKLAAGMHLELENEASTEKWLRWLKCYEALCDALTNAKAVLA